jgi:hypothetical protein
MRIKRSTLLETIKIVFIYQDSLRQNLNRNLKYNQIMLNPLNDFNTKLPSWQNI